MKNRLNFKHLLFVGSLSLLGACQNKTETIEPIRMNQIQVIGSHNSYKKQIQPEILELIANMDTSWAASLDYFHVSLTDQLDKGLRNLELDVLNDPEGGRFSNPVGNDILLQNGNTPFPYDSLHEMDLPGFKVLHIPDVDFRTWNYTLKSALTEIKTWSVKHPNHLPIVVTINAKTGNPPREDFTPILSYSQASYDSLDQEFLSYLGKDKLLTPDDVRGKFNSLNEAILTNGWPVLDSVRGKFLIVLDERGEKMEAYIEGHSSLKGRVMFARAEPGTPESAFLIINDPKASFEEIQNLVKSGYMIRTRADADTREARLNDYSRLEAAKNSGAQVITTDYYLESNKFGNEYHASFSGDSLFRYNPITLVQTKSKAGRLE